MEDLFALYRCLITTLHGMNRVDLIEALQHIVTTALASYPVLTLPHPPTEEPRYEATTTLEQIPTHRSNYIVSQPSHQIPETTSYPVISTRSLALVDQLDRLPTELHDRPCADAHLVKLSKYIMAYDKWKELAPFLHLSSNEVKEIIEIFYKGNQRFKATVQVETTPEVEMLRKWRSKFGMKATYR